MADNSTNVPIGICEDVHVQVAHHCMILTDFVVLDMPEDDNMSIILGTPFFNTAGAVIDCNQGRVVFNVNDKEHTFYFPKRTDKTYGLNSIINIETIQIGQIHVPIPQRAKEFYIVMVGAIPIKIEVT